MLCAVKFHKMQTDLKLLLDEIDNFHNLEDLDYDLFDKVEGELLPNSKVEIHWKDRENADFGYVFVLPHQTADEFDVCIHVPTMDNSDGMDKGEEIHKHIYSIVELERVVKVVATGGMLS